MQALNELLNTHLFNLGSHSFTLGALLYVPSVLVVGYFLIRWVAQYMVKRLLANEVDPNLVHLIRRIFYILSILVLGITVLDLIDVPITAFAFVSGAVAIGFGFGAQNIINNFISGWILMWEQPIRIGDFLEVGENKGRVEAINTRSTRFRRTDGVHMLIPNSILLENTVVNWTLIDNLTRTIIRVGVAYGSDVKRVRALFLQAITEQEAVLKEPEAVVIFEDFADSALVFDGYFWINASVERDLRVIRSEIRFRLVELFEENDIVISFPQRDVHIDGQLKLVSDTKAED